MISSDLGSTTNVRNRVRLDVYVLYVRISNLPLSPDPSTKPQAAVCLDLVLGAGSVRAQRHGFSAPGSDDSVGLALDRTRHHSTLLPEGEDITASSAN